MASATLLKPDAVKVENEIDSNEMEPLTKGVVFCFFLSFNSSSIVIIKDHKM